MGGEFGGEWLNIYVWLSMFALHLNYHSIVTWLENKVFFFLRIFLIKNTMCFEDMRYFRGWLNFVLNNIEFLEVSKKGK